MIIWEGVCNPVGVMLILRFVKSGSFFIILNHGKIHADTCVACVNSIAALL